MLWRLDGGAWTAPAGDGSFAVGAGRVEVQALDRAGLAGTAAPIVLSARHRVLTAVRSVAVALRGAKGDQGLLGSLQLRVKRDAAGQTLAAADLRPLAVGAGRYRTTLRISSGGLRDEGQGTATLRRGQATARLTLGLSRVRRPTSVVLQLRRRTGKRWVVVASATATVKPPAAAQAG